MNAGVSVPLKSLYIELGQMYGVSPQGVESGPAQDGQDADPDGRVRKDAQSQAADRSSGERIRAGKIGKPG